MKTGSNRPSFDPKWGRYTPDKWFNADQVPLPFAIDRRTTYQESAPAGRRGDHMVWVGQPANGLEKRQCSMQVCFSPVKDKCRIAIIFSVTGKRISEDEKAAYHKGVEVYWQKCAWADREVSVQLVEKTLGPAVMEKDEFELFCDNLDGQTCDALRDKFRQLGGDTRHLGKLMLGNQLMVGFEGEAEQQEWLEYDENIEKWIGNDQDRRILITHWVGDAFEKLQGSKYDYSR